ncbi:TPA: heat resistance membrane protein HdeD-GI, partial [Escherichia coli]|nr:heat resistance membrane protein HdeD-GI [Escherichia coli]HBU6021663.1 heat resistance membrane protein HdeD-GI [Escherichia coli]HCX5075613.1 heat resistance membrane protein HdeD-GI [Escherichia coli]HCX5908147.1 heat resistance membrane protein HdeD-GI [Escherichia coli]
MNTDTITDSSADDPTKALCSLSQNWWLFVLRGVLALIFAALAFWMPQSALLAMTIMFGAFSLVNG